MTTEHAMSDQIRKARILGGRDVTRHPDTILLYADGTLYGSYPHVQVSVVADSEHPLYGWGRLSGTALRLAYDGRESEHSIPVSDVRRLRKLGVRI